MKNPIELMRCPACGSTKVETQAWVDINTCVFCNEIDDGHCYCEDCEEGFLSPVTLPELYEDFLCVGTDEQGKTTEKFLKYPAGTPHGTILKWFADQCLLTETDDD